jgi:lipid A 3-O-deacylase
MTFTHRLAAAGIAGLLVSGLCLDPATAQTGETQTDETPGSFTVQVENDLFGGGSDRHYTQGMRFSWLAPEASVPDWARQGATLLPGISPDDHFTYVFAVGQNMYTPEDISRPDPDPTDRPYAGWLYASLGAVVEDSERDLLHNISLDVGVVGPWSQAGRTQRWWHEVIGVQTPRGWGNQLHNEPGVILTYETRMRAPVATNLLGLEVDATPKAGVTLGNIFTHGTIGGALRIGNNLDLDYGPPMIRPSLPGAGLVKRRGEWGWYVFLGVEGRAVARNIFLDGNTFRDSPSVDKKPLIGDLQAGLVFNTPRFQISLTEILRSEEFDGQKGSDQFGAISFTVLY